MKKFIKGKEEGIFLFTNNTVENIKMSEGFNKNHLAKCLYEQCEMYKHIIHNLLENEKLQGNNKGS